MATRLPFRGEYQRRYAQAVVVLLGCFILSTAAAAKSLQSCPTPCSPIDGSPPGSPVPGVLQARVLEWGAIAFSDLKHYILYIISK